MKAIFLNLLALLVTINAFAAPTITAIQNNGQWTNNSTWSLNRRPASNDTIVIPANITLNITTFTATLSNVYIQVYGNLNFIDDGRLELNVQSKIFVYSGGRISIPVDGRIRIDGTPKLEGGDNPVVGAAYADNTTGESPNGFTAFSVLSVQLLNFELHKMGDGTRLMWTTAEEQELSHFQIQKKVDGCIWQDMGMVSSRTNPSSLNAYEYTDQDQTGKYVHYRLKQVDKNGKYSYSNIKSIRIDQKLNSTVYVTANRMINVDFKEQIKSKLVIRIISHNGHLIEEQILPQASRHNQIQIRAAAPGMYVVQVIAEGNTPESKKLLL